VTNLHSDCPSLPDNSGCPCKRLLEPWNTSKPPEFVCYETMRASVRKWVDDRADEVVTSLTTTSGGMQPISLTVLDDMNPELSNALGKLIEVACKNDLFSQWPFPLGDRFLAFVFEQWVQEAPDRTLANLIDIVPSWSLAIERLRARWVLATCNGPVSVEVAQQLLTDIAGLLQQCRIPVTPANIGYGIAHTAGDRWEELPDQYRRLIVTHDSDNCPLPARGVRLTTLGFASLKLWRSNKSLRQ
jgi:hypothetical protein